MARDFNGSSDRIILSSAPATAVPITLAAWFYFDTSLTDTQEYTILTLDSTITGAEFTIEIGRDSGVDYAIAMVFAVSSGLALSSVAPLANTWNHIAGTFSSSTRRDVFLNGVNVGNNTTDITPVVDETSIGATDQGASVGKYFDGRIAETGIWTRILTDAEIAQLATGYAPSFFPQNLVFYSDLRGQNTPEKDRKSGSYLTMAGTSKIGHPDFMKYPGDPNTKIITRPGAFKPGIAR